MEFSIEAFNDLQKRNAELEQLVKEQQAFVNINKLNESQQIAQIGSWIWDIENNHVEWSEMMYSILGIEPNKEIPSYELALHHVHHEDRKRYQEVLGQALQAKQNYYLENRIVKQDATIIYVVSRGICICNEENELVRMEGTVQDVTLLKQLINTNKQLEQFAIILSHDFKAPIQTIRKFIELLKSKSFNRFSEEEKKYFSFIDTNSEKLLALINDILVYARLGSTEVNITKIYTKELLESVIFDLKFNIESRGGEVLIGSIPEVIFADRIKLREVIYNLIYNAIKYTDPKIKPRIQIYTQEDHNQSIFNIKDNGTGIRNEYVQDIFSPYVKTDIGKTDTGAGMGLSICKRIIELHKGHIGYLPNIKGGTCFYFSIPKRQD